MESDIEDKINVAVRIKEDDAFANTSSNKINTSITEKILDVEFPFVSLNATMDTTNVLNVETCTILKNNMCIDNSDNLIPERTDELVIDAMSDSSEAEGHKINSDNTNSFDSLYYNWTATPKLLGVATEEYQPSSLYENFTKGCFWSPDNTCLLVPSEDFRVRIYELPGDLYSGKILHDRIATNFIPAITVREGGLIYDSCWYPFMNSWDPPTCCFLSTSRESPVHLWDAFTGKLRVTYRSYNQVDEIEAAISVRFVSLGKEVWCGFKNAIRIFDTECPTRQARTIQFKTDFPNIRGLVSCIRENPVMPGLVAFGTYSKCIGLYKDGPLCTFRTENGVTQVEFSPCGTKLYSTVRRNNEFLCWDLRNPGIVLYSLQGRQSDTNQRIQFAITSDGKHIVSGGTNGSITVWELTECMNKENNFPMKCNIKCSIDCVNGVSLHKSLPIAAVTTGQRICDIETRQRENSVKLWWLYS